MPKPKAASVDTTELVAHLQAEHETLGTTHPERSVEIEQQLASLGAPVTAETGE